MDWAHRPIVVLAGRTLRSRPGRVIDLGCGNGALLRKIRAFCPGAVPYGIDREAERIAHARLLLPDVPAHLLAGDVLEVAGRTDLPERFALALLSPRRLHEAGPVRSRPLLDWIRGHCDRLLVYAYGRGRTEFGDLAGFARAVGIEVEPAHARARAGLARLG
jgi:hypothetical protein